MDVERGLFNNAMKLPVLPSGVPDSVKKRIRRDDQISLRPLYSVRAILTAFPRLVLIIILLAVPLYWYFRGFPPFHYRTLRYVAICVVSTSAIVLVAYLMFLTLLDKYNFAGTRLREKFYALWHLLSRKY